MAGRRWRVGLQNSLRMETPPTTQPRSAPSTGETSAGPEQAETVPTERVGSKQPPSPGRVLSVLQDPGRKGEWIQEAPGQGQASAGTPRAGQEACRVVMNFPFWSAFHRVLPSQGRGSLGLLPPVAQARARVPRRWREGIVTKVRGTALGVARTGHKDSALSKRGLAAH